MFCQKARKISKTNVVMSKEHRFQDEGDFPLAYFGTIRASKKSAIIYLVFLMTLKIKH